MRTKVASSLPEPEEITEEMKKHCTCDVYDWVEHTCPYQEEIYGNKDYLCICCPYCTQECFWNI
jgi:hypothetical protein